MASVLITGGSGYLGQFIAQALAGREGIGSIAVTYNSSPLPADSLPASVSQHQVLLTSSMSQLNISDN